MIGQRNLVFIDTQLKDALKSYSILKVNLHALICDLD